MQIATSTSVVTSYANPTDSTDTAKSAALNASLSHYQIIRRNGAVVPFEPAKIAVAMMKAFWRFMAHKAQLQPAFAKQ